MERQPSHPGIKGMRAQRGRACRKALYGAALRLWGACLLCGALLPGLACAGASAAPVQAERALVQAGREDGRGFTLQYAVWTEDALRLDKPGLLVLVVDDSLASLGLCTAPSGRGYAPGRPYEGIDGSAPLYIQQEGAWVPVRLQAGAWRTLEGETVGVRHGGKDTFQRALRAKGVAKTKLQAMREAIKALLDKLGQNAPRAQVEVIACGGQAAAAGQGQAGQDSLRLLGFLDGREPQGAPSYAAALEMAADLAEASPFPACVATLACQPGALAGAEALSCQASLQRVREAGGRSLVALLAQTGEEDGALWGALASAPLEGSFFPAASSPAPCLEQAYRRAAGVWQVQVIEKLDPRFTLSPQECARLEATGARAVCQAGRWQVEWEVELPRGKDAPWQAALSIEPKRDFPGGNGVAVSLEGGVWQEGASLVGFPPVAANVGVALQMKDVKAEIFLGEALPTRIGGGSVEARMLGMAPNWYGQGKTGAFSYQWETASGMPAGSLKQLGESVPQASVSYRLRAVFTPYGSGAGAAGPAIGQVAAEGVYQVRVVPGTLRVRATGPGITQESRLALTVEGQGQRYELIALPEADPQGGGLALVAQLAGLPYGKYRVVPQDAPPGLGAKPAVCLLGVCLEDDTVDTRRSLASVVWGGG